VRTLVIRTGLIMPQTADDSLFAHGAVMTAQPGANNESSEVVDI